MRVCEGVGRRRRGARLQEVKEAARLCQVPPRQTLLRPSVTQTHLLIRARVLLTVTCSHCLAASPAAYCGRVQGSVR